MNHFFKTLFKLCMNLIIYFLESYRFALISLLTPRLSIAIGPIGYCKFKALSRSSLCRTKNVLTKEPMTVKWILDFAEGDIFFDVGANIGTYSLMAGLRGHKVFAFEPMGGTFCNLLENINLNCLDGTVTPFCIALTEKTDLGWLNIDSNEIGYSGNQFNRTQNYLNEPLKIRQKVRALGFSIDDFIRIFDLAIPNHIKLDIDGGELDCLKGAEKTLTSKSVESVLVEVEETLEGQSGEITRFLEEKGFVLRSEEQLTSTEKSRCVNKIFVRA